MDITLAEKSTFEAICASINYEKLDKQSKFRKLLPLTKKQFTSKIVFLMWRSHQPRFHPDLNRGLYRERVGVVLSAPIRSYHVLISILTIGLIVENFLAAKKYFPINTIASTIGTIASDRMTS